MLVYASFCANVTYFMNREKDVAFILLYITNVNKIIIFFSADCWSVLLAKRYFMFLFPDLITYKAQRGFSFYGGIMKNVYNFFLD